MNSFRVECLLFFVVRVSMRTDEPIYLCFHTDLTTRPILASNKTTHDELLRCLMDSWRIEFNLHLHSRYVSLCRSTQLARFRCVGFLRIPSASKSCVGSFARPLNCGGNSVLTFLVAWKTFCWVCLGLKIGFDAARFVPASGCIVPMQVVGPLSVLENIFVADGNVLSVRSCTGLLAPLTALLSLSCASLSRPGSSLSSSSEDE